MKLFLIIIRIFFLLASIFCCLSTLIYYEVIFDQEIPPSKIVSVIIFSTGLLFIYCALSGWPEVIRFTEYIKTIIRGKRKNAKTTKVAKLSGLLSGLGTWALIPLVLVHAGVFSAQVLGIGILETDMGLVIFVVLLFLLGPVLAVFVGKFINFMWGSYSNSRKYLINIISSLIVLAELFILIQPNSGYNDKDNGLKTFWYENGEKKNQSNFKNGKVDGLVKGWYENGNKKLEKNVKDGKQDGSAVMWYENGQKMEEIMFKNDQKDGLETQWHENGQKKSEVNFKDGKHDGLGVEWHENGQKSYEANFKDGKRISEKFWNSKGEPVDSILEAESE